MEHNQSLERKMKKMGRDKRCVECGHNVKSLFIQYSPGNIRLIKCENCNEVADEYIECELMIIFIDLVLHRSKAYRHLLYNVFTQNAQHLLWKLLFASLVLDIYRSLLLPRTNDDESSVSLILASLKVLVNVISANLAFVISFALVAMIMSIGTSRGKEILLGVLISSYVKIFLFAMPVWELPVSVIYIVDILVLTSNTVALKVITESTTTKCLTVCLMAHSFRFLADQASGSNSYMTLLMRASKRMKPTTTLFLLSGK